MPNFGGFLGALGDAFVGYGADQEAARREARESRLDQMNVELHGAQMENYRSEASLRRQRAAQEARMRTPEFEDLYVKATNGDPIARAKVVAIVSGHPNEAAVLAPFNQRPRRTYDALRGGMVDEDAGTFTAIPNMPPRVSTSEDLATKRLGLQEQASARAERASNLAAARTALDESIRAVPHPSRVQQTIANMDAGDSTHVFVTNPEYSRAVRDSTAYDRDVIMPARKNLNRAVGQYPLFQQAGAASDSTSSDSSSSGNGPPSTDPGTVAKYLKDKGYTRAQTFQQMKAWGFSVIDPQR